MGRSFQHTYIGIDLGTSSVKLLLAAQDGTVLNAVTGEYPLAFPRPGWSEQNPEDWSEAVAEGIRKLLRGFDAAQVRGIGCGGQMHGLVILDREDRVIRPAILWNDGRPVREVEYLNNVVGRERLTALTGNIAFAGFTAPKLLWLRENEPENFARISKIMLPKDYINYMLTGVHSCEPSDASGTLLYDVKNRCWSREMLKLCGVAESQMPALHESAAPIGFLRPELAETLGLPDKVAVCAGAGDNAAAAVGCGVVGSGKCNISLGTSGTVFITSDSFTVDPGNALHSFAHADGGFHQMGCILSAAACNKWWMDVLRAEDYGGEQEDIRRLGENHVYFLPYLMGERSPHNDVNARGAFVGMSMETPRESMTQAVLEGVAFAIRDCMEAAKAQGIRVERSMICGGGARSVLWRRIMANVLGIPLTVPKTEQGPAYGGAILAAVASGDFESVEACCENWVYAAETVTPESELTGKYEARYRRWRSLYPALREFYQGEGNEDFLRLESTQPEKI